MKRRFSAMILAWMLLVSLTACGGSEASKSEETASDLVSAPESAADYGGGVEYGEAQLDSGTSNSNSGVVQKLICTAQLEMETTEFDTAAAALTDLTEQFQGYFENSTVGERGSGYRWAEYTIRIPAEKYQMFLNQAGDVCHETWRNTTQRDVTESYCDTEGRLKTQQIKLERLQALLARAELMEDIITIESAISETEWEIEELSGTLRHYDGLVNYATVYISLTEVYKLSDVDEVPDSFGTRLSSAFGSGWSSFVDGLENLAVGFAYSWMWWLVLAVVAVVVVRMLRKHDSKMFSFKKKKADDKQGEN